MDMHNINMGGVKGSKYKFESWKCEMKNLINAIGCVRKQSQVQTNNIQVYMKSLENQLGFGFDMIRNWESVVILIHGEIWWQGKPDGECR